MATLPFTVFTPTYNRAATLPRVFQSLLKQHPSLFEWLVIDDGSSDDTARVLKDLGRQAPFPMRIFTQTNSGKHVAHNRAVEMARGELTVVLDSDDELTPGALAILLQAWNTIPAAARQGFAGVLAHSVDENGERVGRPYPKDQMDASWLEMAARGAMVGDKLPCYRTEVLRAFPFPDTGRSACLPEGIVWCRIGELYLIRFINQVVRVYHCSEPDLISLTRQYRHPGRNAPERLLYCQTVLALAPKYLPRYLFFFARTAINYTRFSLHAKQSLFSQFSCHHWTAALLLLVSAPIGIAIWSFDQLRGG